MIDIKMTGIWACWRRWRFFFFLFFLGVPLIISSWFTYIVSLIFFYERLFCIAPAVCTWLRIAYRKQNKFSFLSLILPSPHILTSVSKRGAGVVEGRDLVVGWGRPQFKESSINQGRLHLIQRRSILDLRLIFKFVY